MLAYERASGRRAPELDVPDVPAGCEAVWSAYVALSQSRPHNGHAFGAIQWGEIHAWQQVHDMRFDSWELQTLADLDRAVLPILNKKPPKA